MLERVNKALLIVVGGVCILMMLHICLDVLAKYIFNRPIPLTLEIVSAYYMVALVFLPLAYTEEENRHISVELLADHLPSGPRTVMLSIVEILSGVFLAIAFWQTALDAWAKYLIRETTFGSVPMASWPSYFFVPIGYGLAAMVFARKGLRRMIRHREETR